MKRTTRETYWEFVQRTASAVAKWPVWKRGAISTGRRVRRAIAESAGTTPENASPSVRRMPQKNTPAND